MNTRKRLDELKELIEIAFANCAPDDYILCMLEEMHSLVIELIGQTPYPGPPKTIHFRPVQTKKEEN